MPYLMAYYVCDCGLTKVTVEPPATYPYADALVQCTSCGTYTKLDHPTLPADKDGLRVWIDFLVAEIDRLEKLRDGAMSAWGKADLAERVG